MPYQKLAIRMTFSDLQGHSPINNCELLFSTGTWVVFVDSAEYRFKTFFVAIQRFC